MSFSTFHPGTYHVNFVTTLQFHKLLWDWRIQNFWNSLPRTWHIVGTPKNHRWVSMRDDTDIMPKYIMVKDGVVYFFECFTHILVSGGNRIFTYTLFPEEHRRCITQKKKNLPFCVYSTVGTKYSRMVGGNW